MTIDVESACIAARARVEELQRAVGTPLVLTEGNTMEVPEGWFFYYNSKEFVQTGRISTALAGNGPIFVSRKGQTIDVPSYNTEQEFLELYNRV